MSQRTKVEYICKGPSRLRVDLVERTDAIPASEGVEAKPASEVVVKSMELGVGDRSGVYIEPGQHVRVFEVHDNG